METRGSLDPFGGHTIGVLKEGGTYFLIKQLFTYGIYKLHRSCFSVRRQKLSDHLFINVKDGKLNFQMSSCNVCGHSTISTSLILSYMSIASCKASSPQKVI